MGVARNILEQEFQSRVSEREINKNRLIKVGLKMYYLLQKQVKKTCDNHMWRALVRKERRWERVREEIGYGEARKQKHDCLKSSRNLEDKEE